MTSALALSTARPSFHLFAGIFEGELPIDMQFISDEAWIELLCRMSNAVPGDPTLDLGHLDLFLTTTAQSLAWQPVLQWIEAHAE